MDACRTERLAACVEDAYDDFDAADRIRAAADEAALRADVRVRALRHECAHGPGGLLEGLRCSPDCLCDDLELAAEVARRMRRW